MKDYYTPEELPANAVVLRSRAEALAYVEKSWVMYTQTVTDAEQTFYVEGDYIVRPTGLYAVLPPEN